MTNIYYDTYETDQTLFDETCVTAVIEIDSDQPYHQHRLTLQGLGPDREAAKKNLIDNVLNIIQSLQQFAEDNS